MLHGFRAITLARADHSQPELGVLIEMKLPSVCHLLHIYIGKELSDCISWTWILGSFPLRSHFSSCIIAFAFASQSLLLPLSFSA